VISWELAGFAALVVGWIVAMRWVLPRLGVRG
jgi:hypothetical protein